MLAVSVCYIMAVCFYSVGCRRGNVSHHLGYTASITFLLNFSLCWNLENFPNEQDRRTISRRFYRDFYNSNLKFYNLFDKISLLRFFSNRLAVKIIGRIYMHYPKYKKLIEAPRTDLYNPAPFSTS